MRITKGDGACYYLSSIGAILETIFWKTTDASEFDNFMQKIIVKLTDLKQILKDDKQQISIYYKKFSNLCTSKTSDKDNSHHALETCEGVIPENKYDIDEILLSITNFKTKFDDYYTIYGNLKGAMPFLFNVEMNKTINYDNSIGLVKNFVKAFKLLI